jgi:hypothetical protein
MARRATTFRQRDLTAAVKGAIAAGCMVTGVGVSKGGTIVVLIRKGDQLASFEEQKAESDAINEWDAAL